MIAKLYIDNQRLDLFKDEQIQLVSSVADIENITANTTDYSKSFTVPASEANNKIFKHYYNANILNTFDTRVKIDGYIELDGMTFKSGKFRLSKVSVKKGDPSSYTIIFWSKTVSLKDVFKNDELSSLDFSDDNHEFNSTIVRQGLISQIGLNVQYVPFVKKQLYYDSDPLNTEQTAELSNVAFGDGSGSNGIVWDDLRPSLRVIRIIEQIEEKYSVVFSRDFFGRTEFTDLFFWVNNNIEQDLAPTTQKIDWSSGSSTYVDTTTDIGTFPTNVPNGNGTTYWNMILDIVPDFTYENVLYNIKFIDVDNGELSSHRNLVGTQNISQLIQSSIEEDRLLYYEISSVGEFNFQATWTQEHKVFGGSDIESVGNIAFDSTSQVLNLSESMPKMKIVDFLRGVFNEFKLIMEVQEDDTIYVDTFNSYYSKGGVFDISNFIDNESYDVERGEILNEINYKFAEPKSILNQQYKKNNLIGYGDIDFELTDENGVPLDGKKQEYKVPFEQIVYSRPTDQFDGTPSNFMYGAIIDESLKPVNPALHFHYINRVATDSKPIAFIDGVGTKSSISNINIPTHVNDLDDPLYSTVFESNIEEYTGDAIINTLFLNYHARYISAIFDIRKRNVKYKAKLPLIVQLQLKLNDTIQVGGNYSRIDKYTTNLTTGETTFNLINSFESVSSGFFANPTNFLISADAQQVASYVTKLGNFSYIITDNGFGTGWVTVSNTVDTLLFDVDLNDTDLFRDIFIIFTSLDTFETFTIYIAQKAPRISWDSNVETWDNDILTWDNN